MNGGTTIENEKREQQPATYEAWTLVVPVNESSSGFPLMRLRRALGADAALGDEQVSFAERPTCRLGCYATDLTTQVNYFAQNITQWKTGRAMDLDVLASWSWYGLDGPSGRARRDANATARWHDL